MSEQAPERVEVELSPAAAAYVRGCADTRGSSVAAAAARQLHEDALADASRHISDWDTRHPAYGDDAEAEALAALHA